MSAEELDDIRVQAVLVGHACLGAWRYSPSECQWAAHYASASGLWEWYFWE